MSLNLKDSTKKNLDEGLWNVRKRKEFHFSKLLSELCLQLSKGGCGSA